MLSFLHVSDEMDRVTVRKRPEFAAAPPTNNVPLACFVTSHARLHLYHFIEQVERSAGCTLLYCDTDSIIYVRPRSTSAASVGIAEGSRLGEMAREMADRRIVEFVSGGPKNYGLRHVDAASGGDERAVLKIRGIELNYAATKLIRFETMRELLLAKYAYNRAERWGGVVGICVCVCCDLRSQHKAGFCDEKFVFLGHLFVFCSGI